MTLKSFDAGKLTAAVEAWNTHVNESVAERRAEGEPDFNADCLLVSRENMQPIAEGIYWDSLFWDDLDGLFKSSSFQLFAPHRPHNGDDEAIDRWLREVFYQNPDKYPPTFGVCDHWGQIVERWPVLLTDERPVSIFLQEISRENNGGWRWHKNGEYIGKHEPQYEYLRDEVDIESVLVFRIHEHQVESENS